MVFAISSRRALTGSSGGKSMASRLPARALALAEPLYRGYPSPEHAELVAMARAELGDFAAASEQQQRALALATMEGRWYLLPRLAANQERFRAGRPCREPWSGEGQLLSQLPPASLVGGLQIC